MQYPTKRYQRQKGKKNPNLQDLFSLGDIILAEKVRRTHESGLSRIVICSPEQRYVVHAPVFQNAASAELNCLTLKLKYAIDVWTKAVLISSENPSDLLYFWWLDWKENDTSFRHLEYHNFYKDITVKQLLTGFWALLESIADSGDIRVSEGLSLFTKTTDWDAKPKVSCEIVVDEASGKKVYEKVCGKPFERKVAYDYSFDDTPRSFKWAEIKDMFVELTLEQLRLVQGKKMHKCRIIDKALFVACDRLDLEGVRHALDLGANVNALNDGGECPITITIQDAEYHFRDSNRIYTEEESKALSKMAFEATKPIVEFLLEHGADIDLFGFDGIQALATTYYDLNVDMARFLLEHGANPNYNSYLTDCTSEKERTCVSSTVLNCVYEEVDEYLPEQLEIEKLMYQYGGRLYNWGYSVPDREYLGKYVVWMEIRPHAGPFLDNCQETIGDSTGLTVEREDGEIERIDLSEIKGLSEWVDQYHQNYNDMSYDWQAWKERGYLLALEIAKRLPDYVSLYYLRESEGPVFSQPYDKSHMYYNGHDPIVIK